MPSNHLILCHPLLLLPSILPSIREYYTYMYRYCMFTSYVHVFKKTSKHLACYFKLVLPKISVLFYYAMHFCGIHLLQCLPLHVKPTHFALHLSLAVLVLTSWTFLDTQFLCLIILNEAFLPGILMRLNQLDKPYPDFKIHYINLFNEALSSTFSLKKIN